MFTVTVLIDKSIKTILKRPPLFLLIRLNRRIGMTVIFLTLFLQSQLMSVDSRSVHALHGTVSYKGGQIVLDVFNTSPNPPTKPTVLAQHTEPLKKKTKASIVLLSYCPSSRTSVPSTSVDPHQSLLGCFFVLTGFLSVATLHTDTTDTDLKVWS